MFDAKASARFWAKVEKTAGCWLWTAGKNGHGYGSFYLAGAMVGAHCVTYEAEHGPPPEGMEIDHTCRVRHCVRPSHMEAVPHHTNVARGDAGWHLAVKTHCPQGHPYSGENLRVDARGSRYCLTCKRERKRVYDASKGK